MSENQYHEGDRLKKIFEEKNLVVSKIAKKAGFKSSQNLEYYFKRPKIDRKILSKILITIDIKLQDFTGEIENDKILKLNSEIEYWKKKHDDLYNEKTGIPDLLKEAALPTKKITDLENFNIVMKKFLNYENYLKKQVKKNENDKKEFREYIKKNTEEMKEMAEYLKINSAKGGKAKKTG